MKRGVVTRAKGGGYRTTPIPKGSKVVVNSKTGKISIKSSSGKSKKVTAVTTKISTGTSGAELTRTVTSKGDVTIREDGKKIESFKADPTSALDYVKNVGSDIGMATRFDVKRRKAERDLQEPKKPEYYNLKLREPGRTIETTPTGRTKITPYLQTSVGISPAIYNKIYDQSGKMNPEYQQAFSDLSYSKEQYKTEKKKKQEYTTAINYASELRKSSNPSKAASGDILSVGIPAAKKVKDVVVKGVTTAVDYWKKPKEPPTIKLYGEKEKSLYNKDAPVINYGSVLNKTNSIMQDIVFKPNKSNIFVVKKGDDYINLITKETSPGHKQLSKQFFGCISKGFDVVKGEAKKSAQQQINIRSKTYSFSKVKSPFVAASIAIQRNIPQRYIKTPKEMEAGWEFAKGTTIGAVEGIYKKPLKTAALVGVGIATTGYAVPLLKWKGLSTFIKVAKLGTTPRFIASSTLAAGKVALVAPIGIYASSKISQISMQSTPYKKGYMFGETLSTEIAPIVLGGMLGLRYGSKYLQAKAYSKELQTTAVLKGSRRDLMIAEAQERVYFENRAGQQYPQLKVLDIDKAYGKKSAKKVYDLLSKDGRGVFGSRQMDLYISDNPKWFEPGTIKLITKGDKYWFTGKSRILKDTDVLAGMFENKGVLSTRLTKLTGAKFDVKDYPMTTTHPFHKGFVDVTLKTGKTTRGLSSSELLGRKFEGTWNIGVIDEKAGNFGFYRQAKDLPDFVRFAKQSPTYNVKDIKFLEKGYLDVTDKTVWFGVPKAKGVFSFLAKPKPVYSTSPWANVITTSSTGSSYTSASSLNIIPIFNKTPMIPEETEDDIFISRGVRKKSRSSDVSKPYSIISPSLSVSVSKSKSPSKSPSPSTSPSISISQSISRYISPSVSPSPSPSPSISPSISPSPSPSPSISPSISPSKYQKEKTIQLFKLPKFSMGTKLKSFKPKKLSRKTKYQFDLYSSGYKIFGKRPKLISSVTIRPLPRGM